MKILLTGSSDFVGKNLVSELRNRGYNDILEYNRDTTKEMLREYTRVCDFVFHLTDLNVTSDLLELLEENQNKSPILIASSRKSELNSHNTETNKDLEKLILEYENRTGASVYVYRFADIFGKWSEPNQDSIVATFCYNVSREIPIDVSDRQAEICLCYIDDVVDEMMSVLQGKANTVDGYGKAPVEHKILLGELADLINSFHKSRETLLVPDLNDPLVKKLYSTYISFLPKDDFAYDLLMHENEKGSFTEFIKTMCGGQVSINVSKPNISKGNHWHHTKFEKFLVVSGIGKISFRQVYENEFIEYTVSGEQLKVLDIPPGYTHSIENIGETDLVTVMWANELFDKDSPDTYELEVELTVN